MEEGAWEAAERRPQSRASGLKALVVEDVASSLRVLSAVSVEALTTERHGEQENVAKALATALGWLHGQLMTPTLHAEAAYQAVEEEKKAAELARTRDLTRVFRRCYELQQSGNLSWRLWMLWTRLGCSLEVLRCCGKAQGDGSFVDMLLEVRPPQSFPTATTHCNKEKQVEFSRELWDAVVAGPLGGAPVVDTAPKLIDVFLHWMTAAMRGYEVAFIANVAEPFRRHLSACTSKSLLVDAWLKFANFKMGARSIGTSPVSVAVSGMALSGLTSAHRAPEVSGYLNSLSAATVEELSRGPFPQVHSPVAAVAMALGLSSLDDVSQDVQQQSANSTLLCQFALLRLINLTLLSSRLKPFDSATISKYQVDASQRVRALVADPSNAVLKEYALRMVEVCIEEIVGFFQTSLVAHVSLVEAAQSVLPPEVFRLKPLNQLRSSANQEVSHDESFLMSTPEIVEFLKQFYSVAAPILEILSVDHLVRAFLALSRVEFAREVCASATMNSAMQAVTQQLEQSMEQTATPPETILAPILRSLAMHSLTANIDIPPEVNIIAGCQSLAVGLVMQRKLRVLLFKCSTLIDDALGVVFSGLYNVFEPVDAFAHRFLGVCLTHLGQFTPLFSVFPHYLQVTLAAYPTNASQQDLTKVCGAIFGSLFYSEVLTMPSEHDNEVVETTQRMVLWAVRKCCERSSELLGEEDKMHNQTVPNKGAEDKRGVKPVAKSAVAGSIETDGLYLAGLVFELMKIAPIHVLKACAMEAERLLVRWKSNPRVLRELKSALFERISQNCEAEKRAWIAAWYIEVDKQYPVESPEETIKPVAPSRL
ncbi:unnamed protein product [Phytophthora lilii]|uniref:Unnamed protein product n=1 Tax=Phytophthora lilii TaxID=2077276 RepID=A0A9W7CPL7_9STRA|nr:unnamed protein product [Phytophthora lilii]